MWIDLYRNTIEQSGVIKEFDSFSFPMGEMHVRLQTVGISDYTNVICRIRNSDDLVRLLLVSNALDKMGRPKNKLILPYLPYARQDRVTVAGEPHSLQAICNILDSLGFEQVITVDIHSNVAEACFTKTRFKNYIPIDEFQKWANYSIDIPNTTLIAPDEGSIKRLDPYLKLGFKDLIYCTKHRDPVTGKLTEFSVSKPIKTSEVVIVDDICDGGGTFIGLAPELKKAGAKRFFLWVTHGGFTKGFEDLLTEFNEISCTNSYKILDDSILQTKRVSQFPIDFKTL